MLREPARAAQVEENFRLFYEKWAQGILPCPVSSLARALLTEPSGPAACVASESDPKVLRDALTACETRALALEQDVLVRTQALGLRAAALAARGAELATREAELARTREALTASQERENSLTAELANAVDTLSASTQDLARAREALSESERRESSLRVEVATAAENLAASRQDLTRTGAALAASEAKVAALEADLRDHKAVLGGVYASVSWRVTAGFRSAHRLSRKLLKALSNSVR